LDYIVVGFFALSTVALASYGLHLYVLVFLFSRRSKAVRARQADVIRRFREQARDDDWPLVTSQIPIFNELDVAERIIRSVADMDYPADRHEIQVLDDSNDATTGIVDRVAAELRNRSVRIDVVRRSDRVGFKAGALEYGLQRSSGEFVSIFDADFVPPRDFLRRAMPLLLATPELACLQGRWSHLNRDESWLTRAQALGIDGHFAVEQGARAWNGLLMNFNGTAGVWRKAAIEDPDVGGWTGDTLTEDLDLSYRAQLSGWRIDYCFDLACPAELPSTLSAFKSQQRRWATGSIQVAIKLLPRIWQTSRLNVWQRIEATLHLTHYSVALWMLILAIVARPMLLLRLDGGMPWGRVLWGLWGVILVSAIAPPIVYTYARWSLGGGLTGLRLIPQMMALGCGMCVNNALAVWRGVRTVGGEFVRTPKSGNTGTARKSSSYRSSRSVMWVSELALGAYSFASLGVYIRNDHWPVSIFLLMYGVGFITVGWLSAPWRVGGVGGSGRKSSTPLDSSPRLNSPPSLPTAAPLAESVRS
jgi:Glycosyltransferase like family 2